MTKTRSIQLGDWILGGNCPFFLIAGPCVIESEEHCLELAGALKEVTANCSVPFVFKASFDKANRTSITSFRGPGLDEGLRILESVKTKIGVPVISDVHDPEQAGVAAEVLDIIQIPAFLCRQTDLVLAAAETGRIVNVKKGQFMAPWDVQNVLDKIDSVGNQNTIVTERGVSFGYNNLVVDFRAIPTIRKLGCPVVFDATHSVQLPGGSGKKSSGQSEFIPYLARAAAGVGIDGLFLEVHEDPSKALSDGANTLPLDAVGDLLHQLKQIDYCVKAASESPRHEP